MDLAPNHLQLDRLPPWIIAIGASGRAGIQDIQALLGIIPRDLNAAILMVLHQQFNRPSHLLGLLQRASAMPVLVADEGKRFERGHCYIGEPASHLTLVARSYGTLVDDPEAAHRNRTVDLLFHSIAARAGGRIIGVILSGALDDGSRGMAAVHAAGGKTMVITPNSPRGPGMPENAIGYDGPIDNIGSVEEIAEAIQRLVGT
jgi:chemotaxis response regulator CheB